MSKKIIIILTILLAMLFIIPIQPVSAPPLVTGLSTGITYTFHVTQCKDEFGNVIDYDYFYMSGISISPITITENDYLYFNIFTISDTAITGDFWTTSGISAAFSYDQSLLLMDMWPFIDLSMNWQPWFDADAMQPEISFSKSSTMAEYRWTANPSGSPSTTVSAYFRWDLTYGICDYRHEWDIRYYPSGMEMDGNGGLGAIVSTLANLEIKFLSISDSTTIPQSTIPQTTVPSQPDQSSQNEESDNIFSDLANIIKDVPILGLFINEESPEMSILFLLFLLLLLLFGIYYLYKNRKYKLKRHGRTNISLKKRMKRLQKKYSKFFKS